MPRFLVIIEKANGNYSAYSPDLPGCVATGETRTEAEQNMYEAIEMQIVRSKNPTRKKMCQTELSTISALSRKMKAGFFA